MSLHTPDFLDPAVWFPEWQYIFGTAWFLACYCEMARHYIVIMGAMAPQITSLTIVYLAVYSGADQRKNQSSASLTFVRGFHWWPVYSSNKWPVTRKMFPFDDVIMKKFDMHMAKDENMSRVGVCFSDVCSMSKRKLCKFHVNNAGFSSMYLLYLVLDHEVLCIYLMKYKAHCLY